MIRSFPRIFLTALVIAVGGLPLMASGQNLFAPAAHVNGGVVTNYEVQQRILLLRLLRTPGNIEKAALERLIDERLQRDAARNAGITLEPGEIEAGVDEFAQRTEQSGAELLAALAAQGVDAQSFRDFVQSGLAWRKLVQAQFGGRVNISEADIDQAIELAGTSGSARVLISEIFLPTNTEQNTIVSRDLAAQITGLTSIEEFSNAARRFSAGPSREAGGRVENWVPIENLPQQVRTILLTMRPGQVTEPIEIPNALALFQLRAFQETTAPAARNRKIDYAAYYIAGGQSPTALARAAQVRAQVDVCDDLYGIAFDQPAQALDRQTLPLAEIDTDIALELAKLDPGEVSTALTRANGETLVFLMLCARISDTNAQMSREAARQNLNSERLTAMADAFLGELRANATISLR